MYLEGVHGVLIERRHKYNVAQYAPIEQLSSHFEACETGHLDIEQHQVWLDCLCQRDRLRSVARLPDDLDLNQLLKLETELVAGELFIVSDQNSESHSINTLPCARRSRVAHGFGAGRGSC